MSQQFYTTISEDYDRFVNWQARLEYELPFLRRTLVGCKRVLDIGCATGQHAMALAEYGFQVVGIDPNREMVDRARRLAKESGSQAQFVHAGFENLESVPGIFDAVLVLGNTLPHLLNKKSLNSALQQMSGKLNPGGKLVIQNRNFDALITSRDRFMEPQTFEDESGDWLYVRFYDWLSDSYIDFNMMVLRRKGTQEWTQEVVTTRLRAWQADELRDTLQDNGFDILAAHGDMEGSDYEFDTSPNLVIVAKRA